MPALAVTCNVTDPLPEPDVGDTCNHEESDDEADQDVFDVTDTEVEETVAAGDQLDTDVDNVAATPP